MKAISKCPVCHSKDLEQEFSYHYQETGLIGAEVTSSPLDLDGSSCNNCGSKFKFNLKGKCPSCEGTGQYEYRTTSPAFHSIIRSYKGKCPTCNGSGKIV